VRIIVAATYVPFLDEGGAHIADDLGRELVERGFRSDVVKLPFAAERTAAAEQMLGLRLLDLSEASGEPIDRLVAVGSPCQALRHPNKSAWLLRVPNDTPDSPERASDELYLRECKKVFAHSRHAAAQLRRRHGLDVEALYPPPPRGGFCSGPLGEYLFLPGPVRPARRQALAVEAMKLTGQPIRLVVGGAADADSYLTELREKARLAGLASRVEFTGVLSDEQEAALASECRGVLDLAYGEEADGRAVLAGFQSAKPVVTLADSISGAELVEHGVNGLVPAPDAWALAEAVQGLFTDPAAARRMGEAGRATLDRCRIDWDHVIESLIS
jgi:glycosyltransferase involved in cell wall biosynthesis